MGEFESVQKALVEALCPYFQLHMSICCLLLQFPFPKYILRVFQKSGWVAP